MTPTIEYIEKKFAEFNRQMFGGSLPIPEFKLSNAKTFLGRCECKTRRKLSGRIERYDFRIKISTRGDRPENVVDDTLIHEMIHYYIGYNQLVDTSAHGKLFRSIMDKINSRFGRNITVRYKDEDGQSGRMDDGPRRWHVVAVVRFNDGREGIKVLPRIVQRIVNYYNKVNSVSDVADIRLFMTNNPFFNRFPNSSALKVHFVSSEEIERNLLGAERMLCDGVSITRNA